MTTNIVRLAAVLVATCFAVVPAVPAASSPAALVAAPVPAMAFPTMNAYIADASCDAITCIICGFTATLACALRLEGPTHIVCEDPPDGDCHCNWECGPIIPP